MILVLRQTCSHQFYCSVSKTREEIVVYISSMVKLWLILCDFLSSGASIWTGVRQLVTRLWCELTYAQQLLSGCGVSWLMSNSFSAVAVRADLCATASQRLRCELTYAQQLLSEPLRDYSRTSAYRISIILAKTGNIANIFAEKWWNLRWKNAHSTENIGKCDFLLFWTVLSFETIKLVFECIVLCKTVI